MTSTISMFDLTEKLTHTVDDQLYKDYNSLDRESFNNPLMIELRDLYNRINLAFSSLTEDQIFVLQNIFEKFEYVQEEIDPKRISEFFYSMTDDGDLVLYRTTEENFINLIIHPEEDFALSVIHKTRSSSSLEYHDNDGADYEKAVLQFFI